MDGTGGDNRIEIVIPGEPLAKGRPRIGMNKHTGRAMAFTPAKTRTKEGVITSIAMDVMDGRAPLEGPLSMAVTAVFAIPKSASKKARAAMLADEVRPTKRPDTSNIAKAYEDALNEIVYRDDSQIVLGSVRKMWGDVAKTVVVVRPWRKG